MNIEFTIAQDEFRAEIRKWLDAHVPKTHLPSLDTQDGFAAHREWERVLATGNWGTVNWPVKYGGRGLDRSSC